MIRLRRLLQHETFQGLAILVGLLLIFFSTPILHLGDHVYSAADITQTFALTRTAANYRPLNAILSDPIQQMQPWLMFNRDMLRAGQLPLWNPYNGSGVPQLANYQSAVVSPFSLPFYVLPVKLALLVAAFLKLFGIGSFTFLFFKQLKVKQLPALVGGTAFMFSGYNILWLSWPHASAVIVLPAALYFAERIFQRAEVKPLVMRDLILSLLGFSLSLTVGILAGHPETFYFCFLLIAGYLLFRGLNLLYNGLAFGNLLRLAGSFVLTGLLGALLAGIQLVPFAEYLANSAPADRGVISERFASLQWFRLLVYPNLLGNPADPRMLDLIGRFFNYNEINDVYIGGAVLFLVILGILFLRGNRHRKTILFFVFAALIWFIYAGNLLGLKHWFNLIPGMSSSFYGRSMAIWLFALSSAATLVFDHIYTAPRRLFFPALLTAGIGIVFLLVTAQGTVSTIGLSNLVVGSRPFTADAMDAHANAVQEHFWLITISTGLAIAATALVWISRPRVRTLLASAVLLVVFYQGGFLLKDYNPTIDERLFYPTTPTVQELGQQSQQILPVGNQIILPDLNLAYRLPIVGSYDALDIKYYAELELELFGAPWPAHIVDTFDALGLRLFGIDTLLLPNDADIPQIDGLSCQKQEAYTLCHYQGVPRYHTVNQVMMAESDKQALALIKAPGFDPAKTAILSASGTIASSSSDESSTVQIITETPQHIVFKVSGAAPYLVLDSAYYPGWKATVNGTPQPVYRANYAFSAIPLQPGENTVEFYYDPESVKIGLALTAGGLLAIVTGLVVWRRGRQGLK